MCFLNILYPICILYYLYLYIISTITDLSLPRKFVEASADPSGRLMRVLFSEYLECSENWLASQLVLNETSSQNDVTGGKFSWMTRAETHRVKIQFFDGAENSEHNFFRLYFSQNQVSIILLEHGELGTPSPNLRI